MTQAPPLSSLIGSRILSLRAQRVMLDADLAELYEVPTKALVQAVKRSIELVVPPESKPRDGGQSASAG